MASEGLLAVGISELRPQSTEVSVHHLDGNARRIEVFVAPEQVTHPNFVAPTKHFLDSMSDEEYVIGHVSQGGYFSWANLDVNATHTNLFKEGEENDSSLQFQMIRFELAGDIKLKCSLSRPLKANLQDFTTATDGMLGMLFVVNRLLAREGSSNCRIPVEVRFMEGTNVRCLSFIDLTNPDTWQLTKFLTAEV